MMRLPPLHHVQVLIQRADHILAARPATGRKMQQAVFYTRASVANFVEVSSGFLQR
jgi:hypothetical protein